jgi:hypothetical protein
MPKKTVDTISTTIRLDSELRSVLESIASRELRTLTSQMTLFLREASDLYMQENCLSYRPDVQEVATDEEYSEYKAALLDAAPSNGYWAEN